MDGAECRLLGTTCYLRMVLRTLYPMEYGVRVRERVSGLLRGGTALPFLAITLLLESGKAKRHVDQEHRWARHGAHHHSILIMLRTDYLRTNYGVRSTKYTGTTWYKRPLVPRASHKLLPLWPTEYILPCTTEYVHYKFPTALPNL